MEILDKSTKIAQILDAKKADDILIIDVNGLTIIADNFVIASASNENHVRMLSDEVQGKMAGEENILPDRTEGEMEGRWIVLDYGDVLVHIFHTAEREYYQLERLWKIEDNFLDYSAQEAAAH